MGLVSIRPFNFRNLENTRVECDASQIFLIGDNGQGKTNFIEAVHLLCYGSSFRTRIDGRLVRHGAEEAAVEGRLRMSGGVEAEVRVRVGRAKEITVNGKPVKDRAELLGHIPCVVFSHDDFDFVTGPPERKRWFLNQTLSLADSLYLPALRTYRRVLEGRNVLVRERNEELLDHYDVELAVHGMEVQSRREKALQGFSSVFSRLFGLVSGLDTGVSLLYAPSWRGIASPEEALRLLRSRREGDFRFGTSTHGPHRDSYVFLQGERPFEQVASTGQLRLCSLTLRVAQAHYLLERTGRMPILLLDDVILELDAGRKKAFLSNLPPRDQAFFTFLGDEEYGGYRESSTISYAVKAGRLEPCSA
jgi:DNA replication and repair protein RecF